MRCGVNVVTRARAIKIPVGASRLSGASGLLHLKALPTFNIRICVMSGTGAQQAEVSENGVSTALASSGPRPALITPTAWRSQDELALEDWLVHGRRLGSIGRGVAWWIGDWLRYGNARYGERYSRATRVTGYDSQSLMNMVYVASRFGPTRRREGLSWSHHAELAALPEDDQDRWLDLAEAERFSVRSLREELRSARRAEHHRQLESPTDSRAIGATGREDGRHVVCPNCNHLVSVETPATKKT